MANGRTHAAASAGLLTITAAVCITSVVVAPSPVVVALAAGAVLGATGGLMVTPDIDQNDITHEERRLIKFFAPLGWLWTLFWLPYSLVMPHRGMSHTVPQGTLSRVLYIGIPLVLLAWAFDLRPSPVVVQYLPYSIGTFLACWFMQDMVHLIQDGLWPGRAPWRRPAWQPRKGDL